MQRSQRVVGLEEVPEIGKDENKEKSENKQNLCVITFFCQTSDGWETTEIFLVRNTYNIFCGR